MMSGEPLPSVDPADLEIEERVRLYGSVKETNSQTSPKVRQTTRSENEQDEEEDQEATRTGSKATSHLLPSSGSFSSSRRKSDDTHVSTRSFQEGGSWWCHPKVRENWKVVLGAFLLTVVGLALFLAGVGILVSPQRGMHCLVFFIGGLICLIPGAYHLVYIYLAVRGYNGYSLYNLPVFR